MANIKSGQWRYSKSALRGYFKKPVGFEEWFYTGPSLNFGHFPPRKGAGKRK